MDAEHTAVPKLQFDRTGTPPYTPSWINRLNNLMDQLYVPAEAIYGLIWLAFVGTLTALRWRDGVYPRGTFFVPDFVLGGTGLFFLALIHYLDRWAAQKLVQYRWALEVSDEQFEGLCYRLTTLPALPPILLGLFMVAFAIITMIFFGESYEFLNLNITTVSGGLQLANFLFSWWTFGALSYHVFHQLKEGSLIATRHLQINLFQLDPLYAFSGLALRTAAGWLVMAYAWALITPNLFRQATAIAVTVIFMQVVAMVTFITPLMGAHYLLEHKKGALQRDIGGRIESAIGDLNANLDEHDSEALAKLNTTLSSLMMAEERLVKTPTWPWRPGTLSWLVTAVLLPLGLWLLQTLIQDYVLR
jgi:hypothetical protein